MLCRSQKSNVNKDISCSKEAISFIYGGKSDRAEIPA